MAGRWSRLSGGGKATERVRDCHRGPAEHLQRVLWPWGKRRAELDWGVISTLLPLGNAAVREHGPAAEPGWQGSALVPSEDPSSSVPTLPSRLLNFKAAVAIAIHFIRGGVPSGSNIDRIAAT